MEQPGLLPIWVCIYDCQSYRLAAVILLAPRMLVSIAVDKDLPAKSQYAVEQSDGMACPGMVNDISDEKCGGVDENLTSLP